MKGLEVLYLYQNVITIVKLRLFSELSQLKALVLSNNMINEIDLSCFENLDMLNRLELSGVRKKLVITPIKNYSDFLSNLKELELENGPIDLVKQFDFTKMEKLNLKMSELDSLVLERIPLSKIKRLSLNNATFLDIKTRVDNFLSPFSLNLKSLDLSRIHLSWEFQRKILNKSLNLEHLSISNSYRFETLNLSIYPNLTSLDLSCN